MRMARWRATSFRARDLVVVHGQVPLGQEAVILGVEDRLLDVLAGEALDSLPRFPEAQGDDFGLLTVGPPHQPGAAVAGRGLVGFDARLLDVAGVGGGVVGADRAAPDPCDHPRLLPATGWAFRRAPGAGRGRTAPGTS